MLLDFLSLGFYIFGIIFLIPAVILIFLGIRYQAKETMYVAMFPLVFSITFFILGGAFSKNSISIENEAHPAVSKNKPINQDSLDEIENNMGSAFSTLRNYDYTNGFHGDTANSLTEGDFNGDQHLELAYLRVIKQGVFDKAPFLLAIDFSSSHIQSLEISSDKMEIRLINEGDLNGIDGEEITVLLPPNHGCTYTMVTYTYIDYSWKQLMEPILIPTGCDEFAEAELENRIFKEDGVVCFYETDVNSADFKLIKKKAVFKYGNTLYR